MTEQLKPLFCSILYIDTIVYEWIAMFVVVFFSWVICNLQTDKSALIHFILHVGELTLVPLADLTVIEGLFYTYDCRENHMVHGACVLFQTIYLNEKHNITKHIKQQTIVASMQKKSAVRQLKWRWRCSNFTHVLSWASFKVCDLGVNSRISKTSNLALSSQAFPAIVGWCCLFLLNAIEIHVCFSTPLVALILAASALCDWTAYVCNVAMLNCLNKWSLESERGRDSERICSAVS